MIEFVKLCEDEEKKGDSISNFIQADLWKLKYKDMFEGKLVIPVTLFFDDFDTGNCLGSHAGGQKLGGVYIQLLTLPPHLECKLTNIFVNTIFSSHDRQYCGNERVFEKAIQELNYLNENGFQINFNGEIKTIYVQCVLVLGDNLGVNQACGFEWGFNAKYYCRRCRVPAILCKCIPFEIAGTVRDRENYRKDVNERGHGVNVFSTLSIIFIIFISLRTFHQIACMIFVRVYVSLLLRVF